MEGSHESILFWNRYRCPFETALLILLYRFSRPRRIRPEMEKSFGMRLTHISCVLVTIVDGIYELSVNYVQNPNIFRNRMELYTDKVKDISGLLENVWGFIY